LTNTTSQPLHIDPALALLEFSSIAAGIQAADAMVKRAVLAVMRAGTVQPGRFLILAGGTVAEVEEALKAGRESAPDVLLDSIFLPGVHPDVVRALAGGRSIPSGQAALGILETYNVPAAIQAADKGVKGAQVNLMEIRLADGLNGKGLVLFTGLVADVEAALELADQTLLPGQKVRQVVIAQLHPDIATVLQGTTRFGAQLGWEGA
jgi:microcompartment protein CcmL/EutN